MYLIVGLGNPGTKYEKTRHNVGFEVLNALAQKHFSSSFQINTRANAFVLEDTWNEEPIALAKPQTFMNNSGKAIRILYRKYKIKDWLSSIPGTFKIEQKHFQNSSGVFVNPFKQTKRGSSGTSLSSWKIERAKRYIIVVHDDIDLPLGKIKISLGASSGGHKGIESIIQEIKTQNFARVRIGIQPDRGKPQNVEEFVVQKFTPQETPIVAQTVQNAIHALQLLITQGIEKTMNEYN
jgi:peptidyl-tRNA hydrolase, PTH1 family